MYTVTMVVLVVGLFLGGMNLITASIKFAEDVKTQRFRTNVNGDY